MLPTMNQETKKFELPALSYDYAALEPVIDAQTMAIHHGKHHQAYVDKLNAALEGQPGLTGKTLEELLTNPTGAPEAVSMAIHNNGGGHFNHTLFWEMMVPGGSKEPVGELSAALAETFGSFDEFKKTFTQAATTQFGSGWAWLAFQGGKLMVYSTANQDNTLRQGGKPVLTLDVWEHAYYLKYQNRRPEYIEAWWNVVNWDKANEFYLAAK